MESVNLSNICGMCSQEIVEVAEYHRKVHTLCLLKEQRLEATYRAQHDAYQSMRDDINRIGMFLRENYRREIRDGKHVHQTLADTIIMYLRRERRRPMTRLVNFFHSLAHWLGQQ